MNPNNVSLIWFLIMTILTIVMKAAVHGFMKTVKWFIATRMMTIVDGKK